MSVYEEAKAVGTIAYLAIDGLQVQIKVLDIKYAYGNTRYVVTPTTGTGTVTVDSSRVTLGND